VLPLYLLGHLFGAVVGQAEAQDSQHHGHLVHRAVLRLHRHLSCHLPLEQAEVSRGESSQSDDHGCADESRGGALLQVRWRW